MKKKLGLKMLILLHQVRSPAQGNGRAWVKWQKWQRFSKNLARDYGGALFPTFIEANIGHCGENRILAESLQKL
jgi:hypothetical protein